MGLEFTDLGRRPVGVGRDCPAAGTLTAPVFGLLLAALPVLIALRLRLISGALA